MSEEKKKAHLEEAFEKAGKIRLKEFDFENFDMDMLVLDAENLEEHISKQSAAVAYYGALYKQAVRNYEDAKKAWEYREKVMYAESSDASKYDKKPTRNDIEAQVVIDHKDEIDEWQEKLKALKAQRDNLEVFWEGWKQKSFAINNFVDVYLSEKKTKDDVMERDEDEKPDERKVQRAIERMRQNKGGNRQGRRRNNKNEGVSKLVTNKKNHKNR